MCFEHACQDVCVASFLSGIVCVPCWPTCACSDNWGRWTGLCSSYVKLSPLYDCKHNHPRHTDTHTYYPLLAFTQQLLGKSVGGLKVHIPGREHVLEWHSQWNSQFQLYDQLYRYSLTFKNAARAAGSPTSSCGQFMRSKGWIQKYNVDRKVVGPMQLAGAQTKRWPHTQQILPRSLRSVSSAPPETITFSHRDCFWSPNPSLNHPDKSPRRRRRRGKKRPPLIRHGHL